MWVVGGQPKRRPEFARSGAGLIAVARGAMILGESLSLVTLGILVGIAAALGADPLCLLVSVFAEQEFHAYTPKLSQ